MDAGMAGGVIGGSLGHLGGIVGTYFGIKKTETPRERRFAVKRTIGCWVFVSAFLAILYVTPPDRRWLIWLPYGVFLGLGVRWMNKWQTRIRSEESGSKPVETHTRYDRLGASMVEIVMKRVMRT